MKENVIVDKTYSFAVGIVKCVLEIQEKRHEYVLSRQLLRSGTSMAQILKNLKVLFQKPNLLPKFKSRLKKPGKQNTGFV